MKKIIIFHVIMLMLIFTIPAIATQNLIVNGDFEAGNTGFSTGYTYTTDLIEQSCYAIDILPDGHHSTRPYDIASHGDHTSGQGNMMIVNGSTTPDVTVWEQTVSVSPNTSYEFSIWVSNWINWNVNPAHLEYFMNNVSLGSTFVPDAPAPGEDPWINASYLWQSGFETTTATIKIVDIETAFSVNDFAIDDISLSQTPEPATLFLLTLGGLVLRRRKA
jgi:hypothetical protein